MNTPQKYSPEVRERAVRLVFDHQAEDESQWGAIISIANKIGCTAQTLRKWVRQAERDQGKRAGLTSSQRENLELKRANEILRKAAAFFAQAELERPTEVMMAFIDQHRAEYGVEPICRQLPISPSTY
jgi:transposase-like protein